MAISHYMMMKIWPEALSRGDDQALTSDKEIDMPKKPMGVTVIKQASHSLRRKAATRFQKVERKPRQKISP